MIAARPLAPARRVRTKPRSEGALQADIVGFLRVVLSPDHLVYANANAAQRTSTGRAGNAVPGLMPGIPDLSIACPRGGPCLYLEVKRPGGKLSPAQEHVIGRLQSAGGFVAVVTSIDEVEAALASWGIPTRIARAA